MDADQAVSEYSRISATSDEPLDVLRDVERASDRKAERNLYPVLAGILLLLIGAYYFATRGTTPKPVDTATSAAQESAAPASSTPSTPPLTAPSTPAILAPEEGPPGAPATTAVPP